MSNKSDIARTFFPGREVVSITSLGAGRINETWLVEFSDGKPGKAVLQKINRKVFPEPEKIMANLIVLADHFEKYFSLEATSNTDGWRVVRPFFTQAGCDHRLDEKGGFWRMITYVEGARSFERIGKKQKGSEVGRALGVFHRGSAELDPALLHDTLPGFHVTPEYLAKYDMVVSCLASGEISADEKWCVGFIESFRGGVDVLEDAFKAGLIKQRVIHGDPKVSNIMFGDSTGRAASLIDLDTVKPGLLHYDLGDCFRSSCNPAGGSGVDLDGVKFDVETFADVLAGYLGEMKGLLTDTDYELICPAICLISFELGLRYFTDHLEGDVYFIADAPKQNLQRGIAQFRLVEDIKKKETEILDVISASR